MFGASASVFDFTQVSRCLVFLINRLLLDPWGATLMIFLVSVPDPAANADETLTEFKSRRERFAAGKIVMANKPGRTARISDLLE